MAAPHPCPIIDLKAGGDEASVVAALRTDALARIEEEILPAYILTRRWYGAKDAGTPTVRVARAAPMETSGGTALLTILAVMPPGAAAGQLYFVPLAILGPGAGPTVSDAAIIAEIGAGGQDRMLLVDAFADDRFVRALLDGIRTDEGGGTTAPSGLVFRRTRAVAESRQAADAEAPIERSGVEQSNTSIRIGDAILKGLRKLQPGIHPEPEIGRFLTETAGFGNVPAMLGSVGYRDTESGAAIAVCVLQQLIPNQGDGWGYVLDRLERVEDAGTADAERIESDLGRLARRLGRRTAELHHAFATPTDDEAFRPEPVGSADLRDWTAAVHALARTALDGLERAHAASEMEHLPVRRLLARRQDLAAQIDALIPASVTVRRTRLHGDYHLGQVLVSGDDVYIVDFEGEPMRPLAERRAKHMPLRDVAGMLRSFAYAAAAAARGGPAAGTARARQEALTRAMAAAFLDAYRQAIQGCPSFPADAADADRLLRLFLLEKALYEIGYELANRPDWLAIPLAGVLDILDEGAGAADPTGGPATPQRGRS